MSMGTRNWITGTAAAIAASAALFAAPAQAQVNASIYVQVAPPAPRYEMVPAPRHGHAWVPGHWEWRRNQYVWLPGQFVVARTGYYYAQPQWVQYGNRWGYHAGGWHHGHRPVHAGGRRDGDRDGIPDRFDRDRDNDGRPNHRDFDRDGDGVPNHRDRAPDNRRRY
jgi:WXXGXW repeat (2 copies)